MTEAYLTPDAPYDAYSTHWTIEELQRRAVEGIDRYKKGTLGLRRAAYEKREYQRLLVVLARRGMDCCMACGMRPGNDIVGDADAGAGLEIHHIRALAYGGENVIENFIALCQQCHRGAGGVHGSLGDID